MKKYLYFIILIVAVGCTGNNQSKKEETIAVTPLISYAVITRIPHDINAFTEGFLFHNGLLYESTGSPDEFPSTESIIGTVDLKNGNISQKVKLDKSIYFGEGIVFLRDKLFQLTYKNQTCFVYDAHNFAKKANINLLIKKGGH